MIWTEVGFSGERRCCRERVTINNTAENPPGIVKCLIGPSLLDSHLVHPHWTDLQTDRQRL